MQIKLNSLKLNNFKGIRSFDLELNGRSAEIRAENKVGKSSLADAFSWVLFGKDSQGNPTESFSIKTKRDGVVIPDIDHTVETELFIDGEPLKLKRRFRETYTKKRHALKGHTTDFWIDDEPVKQKVFNAKIAELIDFDTFKLLTSTTHFHLLEWKKRRQILFQICEGLSEESLNKAEKQKKIIAEKIKGFKKEKEETRPRIDELHKIIATTADYNAAEIQAWIAKLEKQIQDIQSDSTKTTLQKEQAELETKLGQIEAGQEKEKQKAISKVRAVVNEIENDHTKTKRIIGQIEYEVSQQADIISTAETEISSLYEDWDRITKKEPTIFDLCPTCGKPFLPEEKEAVQADFNLSQSKKKEKINIAGKKARGKKEKAMAKKIELEVDLKQEQMDIARIEEALNKKKAELEEWQQAVSPISKQVREFAARITDIEDLLSQDDRKHDILGLEIELKAKMSALAEIDASKKTKIRIKELKQEERSLAAEIEKLESQLLEAEEEIKKQAAVVEGLVNQKFEYATFQLFKSHLNEAVDPCCKILTKDTHSEWGHGASGSEIINMGLDIVRTLQNFYGIKCPLFIDNCEQITNPIDPGSQTIKLIKDENYPKMEIIIDE